MLTALISALLASAGGLPTAQYMNSYDDLTAQTTYTFAGVNFGPEGPRRLIAVYVHGFHGAGRTISSATIGGVAATIPATSNPSVTLTSAWIYAVVPTGATGTVSITLSGAGSRLGIRTFNVANLQSTVHVGNSIALTGANTLTTSLDGVGLWGVNYTSLNTITWTGPTEQFEDTLSTFEVSGAVKRRAVAVSENASIAAAGGSSYRLAGLSFR